jgi:hypothetical protein
MIRKMLLTVAVAALVVPAVEANAQAGQVQATAVIGEHILLSGAGDLSFGTVARTQDAVVSPTDGSVTRTVAFNRNVRVTFVAPTALTTGGGASLPVTLYCASNSGGTWTGATSVCGSAPIDLDVGSVTTTATLGFGGRILQSDIEAALAGTYSGSIDITVVAR